MYLRNILKNKYTLSSSLCLIKKKKYQYQCLSNNKFSNDSIEENELANDMNYQTSYDIKEFRNTIEDFARDFIQPYADQIDKDNEFPKDINLWEKMGDFGLHGKKHITTSLLISNNCI